MTTIWVEKEEELTFGPQSCWPICSKEAVRVNMGISDQEKAPLVDLEEEVLVVVVSEVLVADLLEVGVPAEAGKVLGILHEQVQVFPVQFLAIPIFIVNISPS